MTTFLVILIILAAIATVVALVRGIVSFLRTTEEDLKSGQQGPSASSLKQNKMMMARIGFQALAVLLVALVMLMSGGGRSSVTLNKIYTSTGDTGPTVLVDGSRVAKSDVTMAALGDVDHPRPDAPA